MQHTIRVTHRRAVEHIRRLIAFSTYIENGEINHLRDAFRDYLQDTQSGVDPKDMVVTLRNLDEELQRTLEE